MDDYNFVIKLVTDSVVVGAVLWMAQCKQLKNNESGGYTKDVMLKTVVIMSDKFAVMMMVKAVASDVCLWW